MHAEVGALEQQRAMAGLTYDLGLNTADQDDTPDTTPGRTTPYVPAAPGVDPKKAHAPPPPCTRNSSLS